jgi:hypothetical protein
LRWISSESTVWLKSVMWHLSLADLQLADADRYDRSLGMKGSLGYDLSANVCRTSVQGPTITVWLALDQFPTLSVTMTVTVYWNAVRYV